MAMSVVYSNFCGRVVSENRGGVISDYVSDTLGNTIGLMDSAGAMTDRWEYWPYGEVVSRTGTNPTPLTFVGVLGYFQDVLSKLFYVRARHLRVDLARWITIDKLWPSLPAYAYAFCAPIGLVDPSGTCPTFAECIKLYSDDNDALDACCDCAYEECMNGCAFNYSTQRDIWAADCALAIIDCGLYFSSNPFLLAICLAAAAVACTLLYILINFVNMLCQNNCSNQKLACKLGLSKTKSLPHP